MTIDVFCWSIERQEASLRLSAGAPSVQCPLRCSQLRLRSGHCPAFKKQVAWPLCFAGRPSIPQQLRRGAGPHRSVQQRAVQPCTQEGCWRSRPGPPAPPRRQPTLVTPSLNSPGRGSGRAAPPAAAASNSLAFPQLHLGSCYRSGSNCRPSVAARPIGGRVWRTAHVMHSARVD